MTIVKLNLFAIIFKGILEKSAIPTLNKNPAITDQADLFNEHPPDLIISHTHDVPILITYHIGTGHMLRMTPLKFVTSSVLYKTMQL